MPEIQNAGIPETNTQNPKTQNAFFSEDKKS